jgi:hypothetical protein
MPVIASSVQVPEWNVPSPSKLQGRALVRRRAKLEQIGTELAKHGIEAG